MSERSHHYALTVLWTGNTGSGTATYESYERSHVISANGKPSLPGSSDAVFRGDATRYNPEELLVAALSSCHMLWFLHLCADAGVVVTDYVDHAKGLMTMDETRAGHFKEVVLHPVVTVTEPSMIDLAESLHEKAHKLCFISNSCNFPVKHMPRTFASVV
jgi:organic hydroperoxide reductase OsmC/OhrA